VSDILQAIKERRLILFVGAGVSASLGTPTWQQLIDQMAAELGFDPDLFTGNYLTLAEYYQLHHGAIGSLRSWMDTNWHVTDDTLRASKIHELIVKLNFPLVYTTNYDRMLERAYSLHAQPVYKIANVRDMARASDGRTQVIKFHGDFDSDESIVLTETDYYERLSFEDPLDVKFRADALGRAILFIGYSLSDINIRLLLHKLSAVWKSSSHAKDQPRSYVFLPRPDPIQEKVLAQWGIEVLTEDVDAPANPLCVFLQRLYDDSLKLI